MPTRRTIFFILILLAGSLSAALPDSFVEQDMCVRCHLLGENLGAPNPVLAWRRSVHFRADSGCADCHGGDKNFYASLQRGHIGLPDAAGAIEQCGKCHTRETALYNHRPPNQTGEVNCAADCVSCHGYHRVEPAGAGRINPAACGQCHASDPVQPDLSSLDRARLGIASLENRIQRIQAQDFPVAGLNRDLDAVKDQYSDVFHQKRPEQFPAAATELTTSLENLEARVNRSSPVQWYLSGVAVMGFLLIVLALLNGYQSVVGSTDSGKEEGKMEEKQLKTQAAKDNGPGTPAPARPGSAWTGRLALLLALVALLLAIQGKLSTTRNAVQALNQTVTNTLVPQLNTANQRATINSVYELKRMAVTLDEIRETSSNEEIKTRIDRVKQDLDELAVKLLVYE